MGVPPSNRCTPLEESSSSTTTQGLVTEGELPKALNSGSRLWLRTMVQTPIRFTKNTSVSHESTLYLATATMPGTLCFHGRRSRVVCMCPHFYSPPRSKPQLMTVESMAMIPAVACGPLAPFTPAPPAPPAPPVPPAPPACPPAAPAPPATLTAPLAQFVDVYRFHRKLPCLLRLHKCSQRRGGRGSVRGRCDKTDVEH